MNNRKLQAKKDTLKSLPCPSIQSPLFSSQGTSLNTQHSKESATRCPQHKDALATGSPQHLFIDVSTELLRRGQSVRFRAPGLSMHPVIKEGETITVVPISSFDIKRGDILLYIVGRKVVAHRVVSIKREKSNFATQSTAHSTANASTYSSTQASIHSKTLRPHLIFILRGDASAICDDPVEAQQILGKVVSVERRGRSIDLYSTSARMLRILRARASCLKRRMVRIFLWVRDLFHWTGKSWHRFRQRMFEPKNSIKAGQK